MRMTAICAGTLLAMVTVSAASPNATPTGDAGSAFARLKGLAGEWEAKTEMGNARLVYESIAGGSAVVEREIVGEMPPMMTVYHLDGNRLILTHYCMAGNQPRMIADSFDPSSHEIRFRFLDATNLATADAPHMHNATLRFLDDNHIESEWQFYENNRVKMTEKAVYARVR